MTLIASHPNALTPRSPVEPAVDAFLEYLDQEGRSSRTGRAYRADLRQFVRFLHTHVRETAPSLGGIDEAATRAFVAELELRGARPSTVRRKLAAVRAFGRYLTAAGILSRNPARSVAGPDAEPASRPVPALGQIEAALALVPQSSFAGARAQAMVAVLYGGGLRLGELVDLNLTSVDLDEGHVHVPRRRGSARVVPLGPPAVSALRRYLPRRAESLIDRDIASVEAGALFVNERGRRLHRRSIQRIVRTCLEEAGQALIQRAATGAEGATATVLTEGEVGPRALRRAFAAHLLDAGADVVSVRDLLGQDALPAAGRGPDLDVSELRARYEQAHPRAR
ncbi:tyrosine-type recombinase/integrase [Candidatus Latescibacterota bacterium]